MRVAAEERCTPGTCRLVSVYLVLAVLFFICVCTPSIRAQELPARASPSQAPQFRVELSLEDSPPFEPGRPLRFVARAEPTDKRLEYHFYFGDGTTSGWVRESQVRHAYANAGAFLAVLFARETALEGAPTRPSVRSNRVTVNVDQQPEQPKPRQTTVRLEVIPQEVRIGESVQARALLDPQMERVEYRFDFGDGQPVEVRPEALIEYRYATPGVYEAFVQVRQGDRLVAESDRVRIAVASVPAHTLLLEVDRRNPQAGQAVRFSWRMEPRAPDVLYLIDFGDGNQSSQGAQPPVEHVYAEPREYRALLRARIGTEEVISNEVLVSVSPAERDGLYPLVGSIAAAIGVLLATWFVVRLIRRKRRTREPRVDNTRALADAGVSVNPCRDPGFQSLEFGTAAKPTFEVRLNPVSDSGKQIMDQGTAARKKKEVSHE